MVSWALWTIVCLLLLGRIQNRVFVDNTVKSIHIDMR